MIKRCLGAITALGLFAAMACAEDANSVLEKAAKAMGAANLNSIRYTGSGKAGTLGQSYTPDAAWPTLNVNTYTRTIDYASQSSREEMVRTLENPPAKGGGAPFAGEQKQVNLVSGPYAWNEQGSTAQPAPATVAERQLQILLTPHGFLKEALISTATAKKGKGGATEVSFPAIGKFTVVGTIDKEGMVTRTETRIANPVVGDMLVETDYSGYKDFGGVKFPTHIVQKQGGSMVLDLTVSNVQPNVANAVLTAPESVKAATIPPVRVEPQKLADGVWFLGGGTHNSVLIEYKDYLAVVEAPNSEERSLAVIAAVKQLVPNKPIKYLINTHHHWDHSSGLRTYVAEGATIITSEMNKPYYEQAWKEPRTLAPDRMAQDSKAKPTFITVKDSYTLTDGTRSLELHLTQGDNHNGGILFGYLPKEKILIEADDFTPPGPNQSLVPLARGFGNNLYDNIQRLKLDVSTIAPLHGRVAPFDSLPKALGKS